MADCSSFGWGILWKILGKATALYQTKEPFVLRRMVQQRRNGENLPRSFASIRRRSWSDQIHRRQTTDIESDRICICERRVETLQRWLFCASTLSSAIFRSDVEALEYFGRRIWMHDRFQHVSNSERNSGREIFPWDLNSILKFYRDSHLIMMILKHFCYKWKARNTGNFMRPEMKPRRCLGFRARISLRQSLMSRSLKDGWNKATFCTFLVDLFIKGTARIKSIRCM